MAIQAQFPAFLRNEPLIWGIKLSDLFKLSGVLISLQMLGASSFVMISVLVVFYFILIAVRRYLPRRYFEFVLSKKSHLKMQNLNKGIRDEK